MGSGETPRQQRDGRCDVCAARARCGRGAPGTGSRVGHRALRGAPASVPPRAGRRAYRMCQHAAMVANGPMLRLLPRLSDDVAFFWTAGADGILRLLHCNACGFFIHPPGPVCRALPLARPRAEGGQRPGPRRDVHRQLPAVDPGQRHLRHRLGLDRRAAQRAPDDEPGRRRARRRAHRHARPSGLRARRRRMAPALHARGRVVSPRPGEEPLERRAIISGIGQSAVGRRLGRSDLDLTIEAAHGRLRRRRAPPRRHRRHLHLPGHGCRHGGLRRPDDAGRPGRHGPVAQLARRRRRGPRADACRHGGRARRRCRPGAPRPGVPDRHRGLGPGHGGPPGHRRPLRRGRRAPFRGLHAVVPALRGGVGRQLARHDRPAPHARVRPDPRADGTDRAQRAPERRAEPQGRLHGHRCRWTTTWRLA